VEDQLCCAVLAPPGRVGDRGRDAYRDTSAPAEDRAPIPCQAGVPVRAAGDHGVAASSERHDDALHAAAVEAGAVDPQAQVVARQYGGGMTAPDGSIPRA
jgi:hypothetical protein